MILSARPRESGDPEPRPAAPGFPLTRELAEGWRGEPAPLFLLALVAHAGAVHLDLVVRPGMLRQLAGLGVAVAQRIFPRAAHLILGALRQARRCKGGQREPQRQRRSLVCVP